MLFLHPMWDNETQRIGMQKCTPRGYLLHAIGELIGFVGLLLLLVTLLVWIFKALAGTFHPSLLWFGAAPLALGITSEAMVQYSWKLAIAKGFKYNCETREASWIEAGELKTMSISDLRRPS